MAIQFNLDPKLDSENPRFCYFGEKKGSTITLNLNQIMYFSISKHKNGDFSTQEIIDSMQRSCTKMRESINLIEDSRIAREFGYTLERLESNIRYRKSNLNKYNFKLDIVFNLLDDDGDLYTKSFYFKSETELKNELLNFMDKNDFDCLEPKILNLEIER